MSVDSERKSRKTGDPRGCAVHDRERERAVFVELHGEVPLSVMTERGCCSRHRDEWSAMRTWHDVEDVADPADPEAAPCLCHRDVGGGGNVRLNGFRERWRRGFEPAAVWWSDGDVEVLALRPFVRLFKRWWELPERVKYGRAGRLVLWCLGYRRLREPPVSPGDPFGQMVEGDTVWCRICERRYAAECGDGYSHLPGYREDNRGRWIEVTDGHLVDEAAGALAAGLLFDVLDHWEGGDGTARLETWPWWQEIKRQFDDRLEDAADRASRKDAAPQPAGRWQVRGDLLGLARERFPQALRDAARRLAGRLEDAAGTETCEHVCEHVWWDDGWVGPGSDE